MRSDQLHATACQFRIQSVRLVGVIADETLRELPDKPLSERGVHQCDFMAWRSRRGQRPGAPDDRRWPSSSTPCPASSFPRELPLLGWREAAVDKRFLQIQIAFVVECLDLKDTPQHARANPLLKPAVARLIRRIAVRQVGPPGAGPQDPQNAINTARFSLPGRPRPSLRRVNSGKKGPMKSHCSSVRSRG